MTPKRWPQLKEKTASPTQSFGILSEAAVPQFDVDDDDILKRLYGLK
jgi:hypothetical protein